jgi:phosphoglucosamine mutase
MLDCGDCAGKYVSHVAGAAEGDLSGLRVLVDCANGAASVTAGPLFEKLE